VCWTSVVGDFGCFCGVEELGSFCEVGLRDEFFCWDLHDICEGLESGFSPR